MPAPANAIPLPANITKGETPWTLRNSNVPASRSRVITPKPMTIINNGVNTCITNAGVSLASQVKPLACF